MQRPANHRDLACTLYGTRECVGGGTPTRGVCSVCRSYVASDKAWEAVALTVKATSKAPLPKPVPRAEWPKIARQIAWMRSEGETGIGSTLERLIGYVGGGFYKEAFKMLTGKSCGCSDRKRHLDQRYPYNQD